MTHVTVSESFTEATDKRELNGDGIGYVESYDFSTANMSQESRIAAITTVASVCYANPKALGSISLYDRLATENKGLPSSSYEFVPVLLNLYHLEAIFDIRDDYPEGIIELLSCDKYGEWVTDDLGDEYLLTNLRALIADVGPEADKFLNTEAECKIIAEHFRVFKAKIDLSTRAQYIRHRVSWQELSRRYVSGKRVAFEFYVSPKMKEVNSIVKEIGEIHIWEDTETLIETCVNHYNTAIASGVKPEEARRILPQAMYTTVWSAWQPKQLDVFYKLRCDKHAQKEIQDLAYAMKDLDDNFMLSEASTAIIGDNIGELNE